MEDSKRIMPNAEKQQDLCSKLETEMSSVGKELSQCMELVLDALQQRNGASAETLLGRLEELHKRGDNLKELCLQILGRKNGKTPELRWTGCAHKILSLMDKSSLEIVAISKQIGKIDEGPRLPIAEDLPEMGRMASRMLERSIQTVLHPDAGTARSVMEEDSFLDKRKEDFAKKAISLLNDHPENSRPVVPYVVVSRHLERIGDHASHIAEEVAYYLQEQAA